MPVGGSRFYDGGGLGQEGIWRCPSCGHDNEGPIAQGCTRCGAGKPGRHVGREAPPPPPPAAPPPPERAAPPPAEDDLFGHFLHTHPEATLEDAFTAGYIAGVREARRVAQRAQPQAAVQPIAFTADHIINRTMVAALELFRDQVLVADPEETRSGEWLTSHQVSALIQQITAYIQEKEPAHA